VDLNFSFWAVNKLSVCILLPSWEKPKKGKTIPKIKNK